MVLWERGSVGYIKFEKELDEREEKDVVDNDRLFFYWNIIFNWFFKMMGVGFKCLL